MEQLDHGNLFEASAAENYQRYFVPAIGRPVAAGLVAAAKLQPGERVLDVACGTGAVARLACEAVGAQGAVTALDVSPGMLTVARAATPPQTPIDWVESPAEDMPLPDAAFDAALCSMGVQFFEDREAGLREMRRVLSPGGRVALTLPGPIPPVFQVFQSALASQVGPEVAGFAAGVFSLHDPDEIRDLAGHAGFETVRVDARVGALPVPPPEEFLWQYIHSTPLGGIVAQIDADRRDALERQVCEGWQPFVEDGRLVIELRMTTVIACA